MNALTVSDIAAYLGNPSTTVSPDTRSVSFYAFRIWVVDIGVWQGQHGSDLSFGAG